MDSGKKFFDKSLFSIVTPEGKLNLFALAFPLFFEHISAALIGLLQTVLSSHYLNGYFVTVTSVSSTIFSFYVTVVTMVSAGFSIILSVSLGEGRSREENAKLAGTAMCGHMAVSATLGILVMLFAEYLLSFLGLSGEKLAYATIYLRINVAAYIVFSWGSILNAILHCNGLTFVSLIWILTSNVVSVLGSFLIMYVFSIPKEQVSLFLSLSSLAGRFVAAGVIVPYFCVKKLPIKFYFSWKSFVEIIKLGFPAAIANIAYSFSTMLTSKYVLQLGDSSYLAKQYVDRVVQFVSAFGWAIGKSNSIMMGRLFGMNEKDRAEKMFYQNLVLTITINMSLSGILAAAYQPIMRLFFAADNTVLSIMLPVLLIDIIVEGGRGMNHMGQNGLNAVGDVKFTTVISSVSCWVMSVGVAALFVYVFGWGLWAMWIAFALDELLRGVLYLIRWKSGKWKNHIIVKD